MTLTRPCVIVLCCCAIQCLGQQSSADTSFVAIAKSNQLKLYATNMYGQTRLNNGGEYRDYLARDEEHPYYKLDDWQFGDIVYDEEIYENVPLFYDLSRDKVITEHSLNGTKIELISEKVKRFTMDGHTFVRLSADQAKSITPGFYDLLYDGNTKVYVRREKALQQKIESNDIIFNFEEKNRVYIFKDGQYYPVRNKNSVIDVFKDRKQEVRAYLKKINAKKGDRETAIARAAAFYDSETK